MMKKILFILLMVGAALCCNAQQSEKQYYLYNIVSFSGDIKKEGVKVKVDDGKEVERLCDKDGNKLTFKTPAAALMYFIHNGWELFYNGSTAQGSVANGYGSSSTTSYWVLRKPCTKEEFDKTVEEGIKK